MFKNFNLFPAVLQNVILVCTTLFFKEQFHKNTKLSFAQNLKTIPALAVQKKKN